MKWINPIKSLVKLPICHTITITLFWTLLQEIRVDKSCLFWLTLHLLPYKRNVLYSYTIQGK